MLQPNQLTCEHSEQVRKQILTPFQRKLLQKSLEQNLSKRYRQRIQIMLLADEGNSQSQICKALGCSQNTARYWISQAKAGLAHQWNHSPLGRPKTVNDEYTERLKELVSNSPCDYGYSFKRWTAGWLSKHLAKELGIEISDRNVNLLLKKMGLSTRPKPRPTQENPPHQETTCNRITISNLNASETEDSLELLFNSIAID